MEVRTPREEDMTPLFDLLVEFHDEQGYGELNPEKMVASVLDAVKAGTVFVAGENGAIFGGLGLVEASEWYSDATFLADTFFYVRPEHRGSKAGAALMRAAKALAQEMDVPLILGRLDLRRPKGVVADRWAFIPAGRCLRVA